MPTSLRYLFTFLVATVIATTALLGLLAWLTLDQQPWVEEPNREISAQQLQQLKQLAKRGIRGGPQPFKLSTGSDDLNSGCQLLRHAYPQLQCTAQLKPGRLELIASIELPSNPLGRFLSVQATLIPDNDQLNLQQLQIGQLRIPSTLLQQWLPWLLDTLLGQQQAHTLLTTVRLSQINPPQLQLVIYPQPQLGKRLTALLEQLSQFNGRDGSLDRPLISLYYQQLLEQSSELDSQQWISVTYFIAPLLRQVQRQAPANQYHLHARAAIMALALYLGSPRFEQLLGDILSPEQRLQRPHYRTLLRGRIDLRQHFLVSAALQVLAEEGLSQAIGEFKELLDSRQGGSGFSFADLAADRAGTLLARHLTRDTQQAATLLSRLDQPLREPDLMIELTRLPEGLTEQRFRTDYQGLEATPYRAAIRDIDQRLEQLRLYR